MIEKPKRPKKIPNQDNKQPQTIEQLIRRYDLDNTKIYDFLDELVESLKETQTVVSATEPTGDNREKVWIQNTNTEQKIFVLNDNDVYEEFISKETLVNYSTTEQVVGTWINGKPLYEKVIDGITPNTTTDTKVFNISNIETVVNIKGIIANWLPINSIVSPENSSILYFQPDDFMMAIGSSQMNKPFRAIVEYTKTTD